MAIRVALNHRTSYEFDRPVMVSPHVVRLRPAPHCRTPIRSYSLRVKPNDYFVNWQQDPQGNFLARMVFLKPVSRLDFEIDLVAEMIAINPFDFFLEPSAESFPFAYDESLQQELAPFCQLEPVGEKLADYLATIDRSEQKTIDFLVELNRRLREVVDYVIRLEPGVQTCEETLTLGSGSCRDSAWLMVQILRNLGLAARFVSGYLIQLVADQKPLEGPEGPRRDFCDLHAWCEVYLPGAGWVGLDPTSGLMAGEGHLPLACTPEPTSAAPITGATERCDSKFDYSMKVERVHEDPRVTKPYTQDQWDAIVALGHDVDCRLAEDDVRLTMGGEPTFVSIDDMDGEEWRTAALGPMKRSLAEELLSRLRKRFAPGSLLHFGQGKWYPGEQLPRWALSCYWRRDGEPIWHDPQLLASSEHQGGHTYDDALRFTREICRRLEIEDQHILTAYEDAWYYLWREKQLPVNVDPLDSKLDDAEERQRLARIFERGLANPVGCVLPLKCAWWQSAARWQSGSWPMRSEKLMLVPGDSPLGPRLPLDALPWSDRGEGFLTSFPRDPLEYREPLISYAQIRHGVDYAAQNTHARARDPELQTRRSSQKDSVGQDESQAASTTSSAADGIAPDEIVNTAMCIEPRDGQLHVFMPPLDHLEDYLQLVTAVEDAAAKLDTPVVLEGYSPPGDPRIEHIKVTPDPRFTTLLTW